MDPSQFNDQNFFIMFLSKWLNYNADIAKLCFLLNNWLCCQHAIVFLVCQSVVDAPIVQSFEEKLGTY